MPSTNRDTACLWDMLDAARTVLDFVSGIRLEQFMVDRMRQMALERAVEIIGEAARQISEEFRRAHPDIPWRSIIGQRNVLAHEYGEIKQERMWVLATTHIPDLIERLKPLIPSETETSSG